MAIASFAVDARPPPPALVALTAMSTTVRPFFLFWAVDLARVSIAETKNRWAMSLVCLPTLQGVGEIPIVTSM